MFQHGRAYVIIDIQVYEMCANNLFCVFMNLLRSQAYWMCNEALTSQYSPRVVQRTGRNLKNFIIFLAYYRLTRDEHHRHHFVLTDENRHV